MTEDVDDYRSAADHARGVLEALDVDDDHVREHAVDVAKRHDGAPGHIPRSIGAASVYLAGTVMPGEKRDQSEVAEAANLSEGTVQSAFATIREVEFGDVEEEFYVVNEDDSASFDSMDHIAYGVAGLLLLVIGLLGLTEGESVLGRIAAGWSLFSGAVIANYYINRTMGSSE